MSTYIKYPLIGGGGGGGGGGGDAFTTIQPDHGTSPVATGPNDTLTLTSSNASVSITGNSGTDTIDFSVVFPVTTATNIGTGTGTIFTSLSGTALQLKTIKAGSNITITNNASDITIDSTGGGLSITGTDKAIVRMNGTSAIQDSALFISDVTSSRVKISTADAASSPVSIDIGAGAVTSGSGSGAQVRIWSGINTAVGYSGEGGGITISADGPQTPINKFLDLYTGYPSGRLRVVDRDYSATVAIVEMSSLRTYNRVPLGFDSAGIDIGKRSDGTLEPPRNVFVSNWVGVGTGATPTASTVAEFQSTTGAVLFPRMTTTQKTALTAVAGMVVFDTDLAKLQVYDGTAWASLN